MHIVRICDKGADNMIEKDIIKVLSKVRKEKKITFIEASESLGLHRNSLSRLESGKVKNVRYEFINRYAELLGYDLILIHRLK